MKSYAEIISCENCKNKLLVEKEDIKWVAGKDAKSILNLTTSAAKIYVTTCIDCSYINRLNPVNMSLELLKSCQQY